MTTRPIPREAIEALRDDAKRAKLVAVEFTRAELLALQKSARKTWTGFVPYGPLDSAIEKLDRALTPA